MDALAFTRYTFEQDPTGEWYAVLPEYPGPRGDLQMIMGADTLLDSLAAGENRITLVTCERPFTCFQGLLQRQRLGDTEGGAYYALTTVFNQEGEVWLCDVVLFAMGSFPENIFFSVSM